MLKRREFLKFSPAANAPPDGYWLHVSRTAMACRFEVTLPRHETAGVFVARSALDEADRLEQQLTVFKETSEVSYINRCAASSPVGVERSLFQLLMQCQELHRDTEGGFDITSAPLSRCWGFFRRQGRLPDSSEIEESLAVVGSDKLRFDHETRTIRFERSGVEINFGSIGKGYALDRMGAGMRGSVQTALLSAGSSSLLAFGAGDRWKGGWKVGIRHPAGKNKRLA